MNFDKRFQYLEGMGWSIFPGSKVSGKILQPKPRGYTVKEICRRKEDKTVVNELIQTRLVELRKVMKEKGVDYYVIPTADFHGSEYVNEYFKVREFFSGFTGSAGTLVVWQEGAALWTDGRYFLQAERELGGTGVTLMKMREEGVPTIDEFLARELRHGMTLGFDGRTISAKEGKAWEKELAKKEIQFSFEEDLAQAVWKDRPAFPAGKTFLIPEEVAGKTAAEKIGEVRAKLDALGVDGTFLTKLDDAMWLLNFRGCDVECNPVAISYVYVSKEEVILFIQDEALTNEVKAGLTKYGVILRPYAEALSFIKGRSGEKLLLDARYCSYGIYENAQAGNEVIDAPNPTELLKAVKNKTELANMEKIFMADNVALTKFIYWLKNNVGKQELTEISASDKLEEFRRQIPEFLDLSFPTIAGYGANGAIIHYQATPETNAVLQEKSFLLVDSGGQYVGGTTDVTRTIALGPLTEDEIFHYSITAAGMIQMTNARFLHGCTGRNLDMLARQPFWENGLDFKHGTGHGVGYVLNVHEGPQSLRWQYIKDVTEYAFEEGMDVTNEPGLYVEGSHGIRIENVMVAKKDEKNEYGQFMHFDTLTWVPLERSALGVKYLTNRQREWINAYQATVYEKLSPYLNEEEREWLRSETAAI